MGRAHAHASGAGPGSEARRVVGDDGARLRPRRGALVSSVVVTGAAKGIGAGIADAFAKAGWSGRAVDRDKEPLEQTPSPVGGNSVPRAGDVADRATHETALEPPAG